jgi:cell division protein FtsB
MRNFMAAVVRIWHLPFVKYGLVTILGVVFVGFLGENSLMAHFRYVQHIDELSEEIDEYNKRYQKDMRQIRELNRNPKAVERIARERYFMKADDEDIYVMRDDSEEQPTTEYNNEAVE